MSKEKKGLTELSPEAMQFIKEYTSKKNDVENLSLQDLEGVSGGNAPYTFNLDGKKCSRQDVYDLVHGLKTFFGSDQGGDMALAMMKQLFYAEGYNYHADLILEKAVRDYDYSCEAMFEYLDQYL